MKKKIKSFFIKLRLNLNGAIVGSNFSCKSPIEIDNQGQKKINITIGKNVKFGSDVEIFLRNNGSIIISDNVQIDNNVRLLAANNAKLIIGQNTKIGKSTVINAGDTVKIGQYCLISGNCYIQSSSHRFKKEQNIMYQPHTHKKISIEDDVWVGANSVILMGINVKKGSVIGALTKVDKDTEENSINSGNPMKLIKYRN